MSDNEPVVAGNEPTAVELKAGQTVWWCSCGRSKNQPFCDGSHKVTNLTPVEYTASRDRKVFFCCCKRTDKAPLCDGTHNSLQPDGSASDA